ncbi:MAG: gamma-glutamyltransferase [Gammaproteobacteria bacterium AqS3]|nr:gamma-glutamyltransferase [Gammaproteobacteria bacterium AqS3]
MLFLGASAAGQSTTNPIIQSQARFQPVLARQGMVVSAEALATQVGVEILRKGGNAVDAAVAVGFALAVTHPRAGNIGGGGFMMIHLRDEDRQVAIDYREMAPAAAERDMYLDENENVDQGKVRFSRAAAGVPGTVAGLLHALERYGTMKRRQVLAPAIKLARSGFKVSRDLSRSLGRARHVIEHGTARGVFYDRDDNPIKTGTLLKQPALARTLGRISKLGADGFYRGETAVQLALDMQQGEGLITQQDLGNYKVVERDPIVGSFRDHRVVSMPPPSSGGIHLVQMLNIIEGDDLAELGAGSAAVSHLLTEAMRRAYADRSVHLGDPDFTQVPMRRLTSKDYGKALRKTIGERATPSDKINPGEQIEAAAPGNTTHFSIIDADGNAVANTYTLNFSYGSGIYVPSLGFFLNNEMDDFVAKPGEPNGYGLIGDEANSVQPGKRPLSSMTPTLVLNRDGLPVLVTGSPGGSFIITTVLQVLLNVLEHGMNLAEAVSAPRIHHQWKPDMLFHERGVSPDTLKLLEGRGHTLRERRVWGFAGSAGYDGEWFYGFADSRRGGALAEGY